MNRGGWIEYDDSINTDMLLGLHEPNTFEVFREVVKRGMTVIDIGANVGYFSICLDKLVGSEGKVYAFEPVPSTFAALERMLDRNSCRNTVAIQKAISGQNGYVDFFLSHTHYMSSLSVNWAGAASQTIRVPSVRLDDFVRTENIELDFIKMDIEGGGVFALSGMAETIRKNRPFLLLESHTPEEDLAIGKVLSENNYKAYRVGDRTPLINLNANYTDIHGIWGTVIGVHEERLKGLKRFDPMKFQMYRFGQRAVDVRRRILERFHLVR
jgi:FkbM family methyltransferase